MGWPPSSKTPASKETRVRVDGCSNSSATVLPSSARDAAGACLRAGARSSSDVSWPAESSVPSRKCRRRSVRSAAVRVLTWNLFHGRSAPPSGRSLAGEFAAALAGWEWDVALLQEVPPWFPPQFGVDFRMQLTSRNQLLPLTRAISVRNPDLLKSWGGGANAILVRGLPILDARAARLRRWPERRWVHGVRLGGGGGGEGDPPKPPQAVGPGGRGGGDRPAQHGAGAVGAGRLRARPLGGARVGAAARVRRGPEPARAAVRGAAARGGPPRRPPVHRGPRGEPGRGARARTALRPRAGGSYPRVMRA